MNSNTQNGLNFIMGRRSVRVYASGTVTDGQVTQLLQAAMAAPSAMSKDPWRFVVIRDPGELEQLAQQLPGGKMLPTASVAIAVSGDLEAAFEQNLSYLLQDCSAAIENLLIAANSLGLGACWVGCHPGESAVKGLRRLLNLPGSFVPVAVIAVGLPGEHLEARTRYKPDFVRQGKWS